MYLPSRRLLTRPASSSTSRCCEIACRDSPSSCFIVSLAQSSNSVWPSRSWSSSRIARLAGAASASKTSLNAAIIGKRLLAYGRCRRLASRGLCSARASVSPTEAHTPLWNEHRALAVSGCRQRSPQSARNACRSCGAITVSRVYQSMLASRSDTGTRRRGGRSRYACISSDVIGRRPRSWQALRSFAPLRLAPCPQAWVKSHRWALAPRCHNW